MPEHPFHLPRGRIEYLELESTAIAGNLLGDPSLRTVAVYLPPSYDTSGDDYPLFVDIAGFTGSGLSHTGWKAFSESVPQRVERLVSEGKMGEVIVAFPDCFTSLGGNQYINTPVMGNWADFLTGDMIAALEERYRLKKGREYRAIFGKSSGGYGAIIHGMLYAKTWGAIACHSGDMNFELCYRGDMAGTLMRLAEYDGNIERFIDTIQSSRKISHADMHVLMILAMAATYDPAPEAPFGIRLPVDTETCELISDRWDNWLAWDPLQMVNRTEARDNLRSLRGLYIDCGEKDQYNLVFGARQLHRRLTELDIPHRYEEFPDNHSGIDYRMDHSLPWLYDAVSRDPVRRDPVSRG